MTFSFLTNPWFWSTFILLILLIMSLFYLYKFTTIILNLEVGIEKCLDILDERYQTMTKILEIPIFFDSIEVRQVIDNIRKSRDAILVIANILTDNISLEEIKEADENAKEID